jgi:hypothetical protein
VNEREKKIWNLDVGGKIILEIILKYNLTECGVDLPETDHCHIVVKMAVNILGLC